MPQIRRFTSFIPIDAIQISNFFTNDEKTHSVTRDELNKRVGYFIDHTHPTVSQILMSDWLMQCLYNYTGGPKSRMIITKVGLANLCHFVKQNDSLILTDDQFNILAPLVFEIYDSREIRRSGCRAMYTRLRSLMQDVQIAGITLKKLAVSVDLGIHKRICLNDDAEKIIKSIHDQTGIKTRSNKMGSFRDDDYICLIVPISERPKTVNVHGTIVQIPISLYEQLTMEARLMQKIQGGHPPTKAYTRHKAGFLPKEPNKFNNGLVRMMYEINSLYFSPGAEQLYMYDDCMVKYATGHNVTGYIGLLTTMNRICEYKLLHHWAIGVGNCTCGRVAIFKPNGAKLNSRDQTDNVATYDDTDKDMAQQTSKVETTQEKTVMLNEHKTDEYQSYKQYVKSCDVTSEVKRSDKVEYDDNDEY